MTYFVADIYEKDLGPSPNFSALASAPRMVGCIIKATQGVQYAPPWFVSNWPRVRAAGGVRYGNTWFRGCYHFADPYTPGNVQADFLMAHINRAGGLDHGDMPVSYDLEGSAWTSAQQIIDVGMAFSERIKGWTGKAPMLYTGATVRDRRITNRMGFQGMWTPHLDMTAAGWPRSTYRLWQYAGDGKLYNPASVVYGFPTSVPGWGATDMNVVMDGGVFASSLARVKAVLLGGPSLAHLLLLGGAALLTYLYVNQGHHHG